LVLEYLIKRKHIFKHRSHKSRKKNYLFKYGTIGFFSLRVQIFELIYFRLLKKVFFRRHLKRRTFFKKKKIWVFLFPNSFFSKKSTNARMGAGVGLFVRVIIRLKNYVSFIEFKDFSYNWCIRLRSFLKYRFPMKYLIVKH
jgi:ribosomal protein L16/L10AE